MGFTYDFYANRWRMCSISYYFRNSSASINNVTKVIIFWLENGKFEFSRKQYIFLKHSKQEFCAEFYYHF